MKIVQRLPVRIELTDYDPDKSPLFVGLSVTPYVYYQGAADGTERRRSLAAAPMPQLPAANHAATLRPEAQAMSMRGTARRPRSADRRSTPGSSPPPWSCPTFMEVLDTTIANVALRYIAGGLSAAVTDSEWVITSYLAANAIILPITGWLSAHLGRRNYFLLSIAVFTIASGLCGMATSLGQIILFRVIQGLAGGGLQPSQPGRPARQLSRPRSRARP